MEICSAEKCTGCGACAYVCPKQCISMKEDKTGVIYPVIDEELCINCKKCEKNCPAINDVKFNEPMDAYAAWNSDEEERRTSASGGIAAGLYHFAIDSDMLVVGASSNEDFSVTMELAEDKEQCKAFKNSKYVFSEPYPLYPSLEECLKTGKTVLVIGLPCQIAAIKTIFKNYDNLYLIDVVCHGTTPYSYLKQHIKALEKEYGNKADKMSFRDAERKTYTFTFTLYDESGKCFYAKRTKDGDTYQVGYHRTISYRENCYHCKYAKTQRISDLTLSDYKGLGTVARWDMDKTEVSCVLANTEKGRHLMDKLLEEKRIVAHRRPVEEPVNADPQLQHPSKKSKAREDFEKNIRRNNGDFETTMNIVIKKNRRREKGNRILFVIKKPLRFMKRVLKGVISRIW